MSSQDGHLTSCHLKTGHVCRMLRYLCQPAPPHSEIVAILEEHAAKVRAFGSGQWLLAFRLHKLQMAKWGFFMADFVGEL